MSSSSGSFWDLDGNGKLDFDEGLLWFGIAGGLAEESARASYEERERDLERRERDFEDRVRRFEERERESRWDADDDDDYQSIWDDNDDDDYYGRRSRSRWDDDDDDDGGWPTWDERKAHTIKELATLPRDVRLVAFADKLSNMRAIARDHARIGDELWKRFKAPKEKQRWYYAGIIEALADFADDTDTAPLYAELCARFEEAFG